MAENYKNLHVQFGTAAEKSKDDIVAELRKENKRLHLQLETMTQDRNYYRAAYHHLLKERNGGAGE